MCPTSRLLAAGLGCSSGARGTTGKRLNTCMACDTGPTAIHGQYVARCYHRAHAKHKQHAPDTQGNTLGKAWLQICEHEFLLLFRVESHGLTGLWIGEAGP